MGLFDLKFGVSMIVCSTAGQLNADSGGLYCGTRMALQTPLKL
jgi:NADP-dependent 3-hydroxy acid dehydrogenase YdfG